MGKAVLNTLHMLFSITMAYDIECGAGSQSFSYLVAEPNNSATPTQSVTVFILFCLVQPPLFR